MLRLLYKLIALLCLNVFETQSTLIIFLANSSDSEKRSNLRQDNKLSLD